MAKNHIAANLKKYSNLEQFANAAWIAKNDDLEPWLIDNPIARWLTGHTAFGLSFASRLDDNIRTCCQLTGGESRVRKLFAPADLSEVWPTMMEIYIASWISDFAASVEFRSDSAGGPDLLVRLNDASEHLIEIKSFQQNAFWSELVDRCMLLGSYHSQFPQFLSAPIPGKAGPDADLNIPQPFEQQMVAAARIVDSQGSRLTHPTSELTEWDKDESTGVQVRWQQRPCRAHPAREATSADPESALRALCNQLTSRGNIRRQIEQADAVIVCVSKHPDLPEFYILRDHLESSDSREVSRMISLVPTPVLSLESLGGLMAVAISLDQRSAHLAFALALPRTNAKVRTKQISLRTTLDTLNITTHSTNVHK